MSNNYFGVMVFCPFNNNGLEPVAKELLGKGRQLANTLNQPLIAAIAGHHKNMEDFAKTAGKYGANRVYLAKHPLLEQYTASSYAAAMEQVVQAENPSILLVGATDIGRDFAARLAPRLKTGLTADCTCLEIDEKTGLLNQTRPAYGGNVQATIVCESARPQMATVRPGVFPQPGATSGIPPEIIHLSLTEQQLACGKIQIEDSWLLPETNTRLLSAHTVVACGRGIKGAEGLQLAQQLADALGGVVAASRGAVDDGLLLGDVQVGQTGKTIRPKLYIACGISGAIQHLAGIGQAECVVAINNDPSAPIMQAADYALCGDAMEILPKLTQRILSRRGE